MHTASTTVGPPPILNVHCIYNSGSTTGTECTLHLHGGSTTNTECTLVVHSMSHPYEMYTRFGDPTIHNQQQLTFCSEDAAGDSGHKSVCSTQENTAGHSILPELCRNGLFSGPEPAILDWYGHCVHLSVNKLGDLEACSPSKILK